MVVVVFVMIGVVGGKVFGTSDEGGGGDARTVDGGGGREDVGGGTFIDRAKGEGGGDPTISEGEVGDP